MSDPWALSTKKGQQDRKKDFKKIKKASKSKQAIKGTTVKFKKVRNAGNQIAEWSGFVKKSIISQGKEKGKLSFRRGRSAEEDAEIVKKGPSAMYRKL